jgi:acetyltransferase-like isoleucine patch superfamily enzyme
MAIYKGRAPLWARALRKLNDLHDRASLAIRVARLNLYPGIRIGRGTRVARTALLDMLNEGSLPVGGNVVVGRNCSISHDVLLVPYCGRITVGDRTFIGPRTMIFGNGGVEIGSDVLIAGQCFIVASNHVHSNFDRPIRAQGLTAKGIVIEDDVWIGAGCKVLDGVRIGRGSIVGAGAVVRQSLPAFSVAVGVPATVKRDRRYAAESSVVSP